MEGTFIEKLTYSLGVSVVAMLIVFAVLVILMYIIKFQSFIFAKTTKKAKNEKSDESTQVVVAESVEEFEEIDIQDDSEIVAAIMGALALELGTSLEGLNIRSIKRVSNSKWNNLR
ncbi:OadG family protein [Clostridium ihumii]|uniref:OadG family protein n=1 Tax=Clostridium ihumii TaxID=1470356 RepID=UPI003D32DA3E